MLVLPFPFPSAPGQAGAPSRQGSPIGTLRGAAREFRNGEGSRLQGYASSTLRRWARCSS